jgi:alanine racemase
VARHLAPEADYVGVAVLEEGIFLRELGVTAPILVLGGIWGDQVPQYLEHDLALTASSVERLEQIEAVAGQMGVRARVHLKIDTGMERIGVHYYSAATLQEAALKCKNVDVEGICSHFANADAPDLTHARLQLERFSEVTRFYERKGLPMPIRHMANSAAILQMPESHLDMVRPGIMLYGYAPRRGMPGSDRLVPVMSLVSCISMLKRVEPMTGISYGRRYVTRTHTRIATVPVGYGDGYSRLLTGKAEVLIHGKRFPVAGTICMDHLMVDVGNVDTIQVGEPVTLIGKEGDLAVTAWDIAERLGTIPYEVTCMIARRVPRVVAS